MPKKNKSPFVGLKTGALTRIAKQQGYESAMPFAKKVMSLRKAGSTKLPSGRRITPLLVRRSNFALTFGGK